MRSLLLLLIATGCLLSANAQLKTPAPSTTQTVKQDFGLGSVELTYSRPNVKKRKIFGDVVPFNQVWRTGANSATTLTFTDEVVIAGVKVPAGKYGLLTIPGRKTWTIIISRQTNVNNPGLYKQDMDLVRLDAPVKKQKPAAESFTIAFSNVADTSLQVDLAWAGTQVSFPVFTETDARIMASIEASMKSAKPEYFQAAVYYMTHNKDLNQSLDWFNKAVEAQPDAYWVQHQWANCLAKLNKKPEAIAAATRSKELAIKAGNDDYVKLNDKLLKELNK